MALREALVNAIAHTDYSQRGMQIMVGVHPDRLEVQSPGTFPFGMTVDDLKAGVSRIRNSVIARVLHELGLMEQWGSGYERITRSCDQGGHPYPRWQELSSVVRVVFSPHSATLQAHEPVNEPVNEPVKAKADERRQWFVDRLRQGHRPTAQDLAGHFGVARATAKRDIAILRDRGVVAFTGAPKTGHYRLLKRSE